MIPDRFYPVFGRSECFKHFFTLILSAAAFPPFRAIFGLLQRKAAALPCYREKSNSLQPLAQLWKIYLFSVTINSMDFLKEFSGRILPALDAAADRILDFIPAEKRRASLFCAGGTVFLLIIVILVSLAAEPEEAEESAQGPAVAISGDDFFLPREPDFVPDFLPGREPRADWGVDEVMPFWKDPGQSVRYLWQEEMSAIIDRLLENVP
ncbi:MAG: hypothetical protein LBH43_09865 [Treponema sp.]|nr:hypothetical protein [Treponema sp.]